jgi:predicted NAD-dependent protein-ADP-ribosyltransferase YbiA (DUF1768 family)
METITNTKEAATKRKREAADEIVAKKRSRKGAEKGADYILFFSRAKDSSELPTGFPSNTPSYLSNFKTIINGLRIVHKNGDTAVYPTVEHAFQEAKYDYTTSDGKKVVGTRFRSPSMLTATQAKKDGGKASMLKHGLVLDLATWNAQRIDLMRNLIRARVLQDPTFRKILSDCRKFGIKLYHFSRSPSDDWGCRVKEGEPVGRNLLGQIMMEVDLTVDLTVTTEESLAERGEEVVVDDDATLSPPITSAPAASVVVDLSDETC